MFFFPFCIIENILKVSMNYSTLQEAFNIDGFEKVKKKRREKVDIPDANSHKGPANIETSKLSASSESILNYEDYVKNAGKSCSPLQAPMYNIPTSGVCKDEFKKAMKTYTEENFNLPKDIDMSNMSSNNNVMPYYDEDLEQYFDINNLNDEVKYNPNNKLSNYMPNNNKITYTNNNTSEYTNNNTIFKNGNNLLNTSDYNLSPDERKKASDALQYLKALEFKIDSDEKKAFMNQMNLSNSIGRDGVAQPNTNNSETKKLQREIEELKKREVILSKSIEENKKAQNNINLIINVFIILFVGGVIILLCDYLVELSIQIGMKKTTNILEPYIHNKMYQMNNMNNMNNMNMSGGMNMPNIPNMQNSVMPYNYNPIQNSQISQPQSV